MPVTVRSRCFTSMTELVHPGSVTVDARGATGLGASLDRLRRSAIRLRIIDNPSDQGARAELSLSLQEHPELESPEALAAELLRPAPPVVELPLALAPGPALCPPRFGFACVSVAPAPPKARLLDARVPPFPAVPWTIVAPPRPTKGPPVATLFVVDITLEVRPP